MKCTNPECKNEVDALHMDDEGYCIDCHNKILDSLLIEESDETKCLSDESLEIVGRRSVMRRHGSRNKKIRR